MCVPCNENPGMCETEQESIFNSILSPQILILVFLLVFLIFEGYFLGFSFKLNIYLNLKIPIVVSYSFKFNESTNTYRIYSQSVFAHRIFQLEKACSSYNFVSLNNYEWIFYFYF